MTSSDPTSLRAHAAAASVMLASGAVLVLLGMAVAETGPLVAAGWWAAAAGVVWLVLAPPSMAAVRDGVVPGIFLALTLGLSSYALDVREPVVLVGFLGFPLAVGPAIAGFLRRTMPPPPQLVGLAAGLLAVVVVGATGAPQPGVVLSAGAGGALLLVHLTVARVLHRHRAIAHGGVVLVVAGALLLAGAASTGSVMPAEGTWLSLVGATILGGIVLPLLRVRLSQHLTPGGIRPQLALPVVGTAAVAGLPGDAASLAAIGLVVLGAWAAGTRPSELAGAEALRSGP